MKRKISRTDRTQALNKSGMTDTLRVTAGIAHDLNNILATISGYAELMNNDLDPDSPLRENSGKILSGTAKARILTQEILSLGKLSWKRESLSDVPAILGETIDFLMTSIPENISVVTDIPETGLYAKADPVKIFRVFLNLIGNAVDAMETTGGMLKAAVRMTGRNEIKEVAPENKIRKDLIGVTIRDTGKGMDAEMIKKIFDPLYSSGKSGTGLGLTMVKIFLDEIDAEIVVNSVAGQGTEFNIYIPLAD